MKFEFEEFETVEEVLTYMVTISPMMKQVLAVNVYKGYTFVMIPIAPLSGDPILMVYTKKTIEPSLLEFDFSTQKYKKVISLERADKSYFIVTTPKQNTLADQAIAELENKEKH
ncbi:MAG: hypothetical protein EX285_05610 [Thaumarchaeota archaeon]|nr:hypothetical protein [Nitrososphaerota archaeon]